MTPQIVKQLLERNTARDNLLDLIDAMVYDVKQKDFELNSQNNYRMEFRELKMNTKKRRIKFTTFLKAKIKLSELVENHYCRVRSNRE